MKEITYKLSITIVALITSLNVSSSDYFEYDGILYFIENKYDREVFVGDNSENKNLKTDLKIPAKVIYEGITYKVTGIGGSAFGKCNLKSVTIPYTIKWLDGNSFRECKTLERIDVDDDNPYFCSEGGILYSKDKSVLALYPRTVKGPVTIPNYVTKIGDYAFENCEGLTSVDIPNSVTEIGEYAFGRCYELTSITIPNSVTEIGENAFFDCEKLTSATLPISLTKISSGLFEGCSNLSSVNIPNTVTYIGGRAFGGGKFTSFTIPNTVTKIGKRPFYGNPMTSLYCYATTPPEAQTFSDEIYSDCILYVPESCINEYESIDPWRNFFTIKTIESTGIDDVTLSGNITISVNGGSIKINGIDGNTKVEVYNLSGELVYCGTDNVIQNIPQGVYIVKVNNKSIKIRL